MTLGLFTRLAPSWGGFFLAIGYPSFVQLSRWGNYISLPGKRQGQWEIVAQVKKICYSGAATERKYCAGKEVIFLKERALAHLLSLALCLGTAVPALAAEGDCAVMEDGCLMTYSDPSGDVAILNSITLAAKNVVVK